MISGEVQLPFTSGRPDKAGAKCPSIRYEKDGERCSAATEKEVRGGIVLKFLRKLQNPYLLVGQGFLVGVAIFFATHEDLVDSRPAGAVAEASFFDRMIARL